MDHPRPKIRSSSMGRDIGRVRNILRKFMAEQERTVKNLLREEDANYFDSSGEALLVQRKWKICTKNKPK